MKNLEVCIYKKPGRSFQNWTKIKKKIFLKKPFSTSIFKVLSNLYCLTLVQKMRAEEEKSEREKGRENENGGKMGIKIVWFLCLFFISPRACFFICAVVISRIYKKNCI